MLGWTEQAYNASPPTTPVRTLAYSSLLHCSYVTDRLQVCPPHCKRSRVFLTVLRERCLLKGLRICASFWRFLMRETFYSIFLRLVALFVSLSVACCSIFYMHRDFRVSVLQACAVKQKYFLSPVFSLSAVCLRKVFCKLSLKLGRCPGVL